MNNLDVLSMCLRSLLKRKMRTFLTVLGVTIGTASIVIMISLGLAVNDRFDREIKNMGDAAMITVYNYGMAMAVPDSGEAAQSSRPAPVLDDNAVAKFNRMPGVRAASALQRTNIFIKAGRYILPGITLFGIDPKVMEVFYSAGAGRLLQEGDKYAMVFGANAELQFFKQNDPNGYSQRLQNYWMGDTNQEPLVDLLHADMSVSIDYSLIYPEYADPGVQPYKPVRSACVGVLNPGGYDADNAVFMDIKTVRKFISDQNKRNQALMASSGGSSGGSPSAPSARQPVGYDTVQVKCKDIDSVRSVSKYIREMGFYAQFPTESLDSIQSMASGMQALLGAIGAVSLLVAAIGIANTMIMSIYERTREIGVMKVIGAALSDIRKLFLLEATVIGFAGGVMGVLLSILISYLLNNSSVSFFSIFTAFLGEDKESVISLITPWLCGAAAFFATVIGLVSGYFPARRAMRLSAVNALNNIT